MTIKVKLELECECSDFYSTQDACILLKNEIKDAALNLSLPESVKILNAYTKACEDRGEK